jgi:hypothetical protein
MSLDLSPTVIPPFRKLTVGFFNLDLHYARRTKPLVLQDLRPALLAEPLTTEALQILLHLPLALRPLDERITAAIIGVPSN